MAQESIPEARNRGRASLKHDQLDELKNTRSVCLTQFLESSFHFAPLAQSIFVPPTIRKGQIEVKYPVVKTSRKKSA